MGVSQSTFKRTNNNQCNNSKSQQQSYFPFHLLSDEIALEIISYVSFAPYEIDYGDDKDESDEYDNDDDCNDSSPNLKYHACQYHGQSTLTHVLPFVSKQFYTLCNDDSLWISSFQNLVNNHPKKWKHSLLSLLDVQVGKTVPPWSELYNPNSVDCNDYMLAAKVKQFEDLNEVERRMLLLDIYNSAQKKIKLKSMNGYQYKTNYNQNCEYSSHHNFSYGYSHPSRTEEIEDKNDDSDNNVSKSEAKAFYLTFIINYIQMSLPIMYIQSSGLRKGISFGMTLLEHRYCTLIIDMMNKNKRGRGNNRDKGRKVSSTISNKGHCGRMNRPRFILTNHQSSLSRGSAAFLAEVIPCRSLRGRNSDNGISENRMNMKVHIIKKVQLFEVSNRFDSSSSLHPHNAQIKKFH